MARIYQGPCSIKREDIISVNLALNLHKIGGDRNNFILRHNALENSVLKPDGQVCCNDSSTFLLDPLVLQDLEVPHDDFKERCEALLNSIGSTIDSVRTGKVFDL